MQWKLGHRAPVRGDAPGSRIDRAEFDEYMKERKSRPTGGPAEGPQTPPQA